MFTGLPTWQDFLRQEDPECHRHGGCFHGCDDRDLCRTESWSRPYGPRKTGCEIFLYHASCLERDPDDSCVFRRKIFHLPVYQSVRDRGDPGVCDLFPHGILGVSIPGHDLRIPKCLQGMGIRTCSDARRCF